MDEATAHAFQSYDYAEFESTAAEILRRYLQTQKREIQLQPTREADAIAPQGVAELQGPTVVEFKLRMPTGDLERFAKKLITLSRDVKASSVLLVVGTRLSPDREQYIHNLFTQWPNPPQFAVWDVRKLVTVNGMIGNSVPLSNAATAETKSAASVAPPRPVDAWRDARVAHIASLKAAYVRKDLVLFLGAGVSMDARMPSWPELVRRLLAAVVRKRQLPSEFTEAEIAQLVDKLAQAGSSPLLLARDIRSALGDDFANQVSKALYSTVDEGALQPACALKAIMRLCVSGGIRAVVSYNFDDLLERQLHDTGLRHRPVVREGEVVPDNEFGVYHVHGYLPRDYRKEEDAESLLVFAEDGYHTVFMDPYAWSNMVQLNFLRDRTCVLVGLSATDPNLRRLVELEARRGRSKRPPRHYVILRRHSAGVAAVDRLFEEMHHSLQESVLLELGLNIVWVEDYVEVPALLDQLRT